MEELLNLPVPDSLMTPEEMARYLKFQSDVKAFYDKHGEHLAWLEQAVDLGLMQTSKRVYTEGSFDFGFVMSDFGTLKIKTYGILKIS